MHTSLFFKLFPPPKYMTVRYAGLEISDDAIRCLQYKSTIGGLSIEKHDNVALPTGTVEGGDIKDEPTLKNKLQEFGRKNKLLYVSVSVPEEKAYLFQTDVVGKNIKAIAQNIEFKLEENVPLSARDAIFYFDLMPLEVTNGVLRASVSVVPRTYIEKQIELLQNMGITPIAFEVVPKSIARVAIKNLSDKTSMLVHVMNKKTGIYVVSGGVVCFTSTISWGSENRGNLNEDDKSILPREINHTRKYWQSKWQRPINELILSGGKSPDLRQFIADSLDEPIQTVAIAETWRNAFDLNHYIPPISRLESLDYIVVAGLALDL